MILFKFYDEMKKGWIFLFIVVLTISALSFTETASLSVPETEVENSKVNWLTFEEAVEKSQTEKRKIFIDVYTEWCGWCKRMDTATFQQDYIAKYLNENYYSVKFDAEYKEDIIFKGKTYKYVKSGRRGYHELATELTKGRLSFPTIVFLDESQNIIQPIPGYKDPLIFEQIITYFAGNWHHSKPWASYQKNYKPMNAPSEKEPIDAIPVKN